MESPSNQSIWIWMEALGFLGVSVSTDILRLMGKRWEPEPFLFVLPGSYRSPSSCHPLAVRLMHQKQMQILKRQGIFPASHMWKIHQNGFHLKVDWVDCVSLCPKMYSASCVNLGLFIHVFPIGSHGFNRNSRMKEQLKHNEVAIQKKLRWRNRDEKYMEHSQLHSESNWGFQVLETEQMLCWCATKIGLEGRKKWLMEH